MGMAEATFKGQVISINHRMDTGMSSITRVDFVVMVRHCIMHLHKYKENKNYWKPISFSCPVRAFKSLQDSLIKLNFGDYVTVETKKDANEWKVIGITFEKDEAQSFEQLLEFNEGII